MPNTHVDAEVSVIGAGPVGSLLAGMLALNGVDVCLFDEGSDVVAGPRAMAVNARSAQIFDVFDLKDALVGASSFGFGHFGHQKVDLARTDTPWPGMWPSVQQDLNRTLIAWAVDAGAQLVRGSRFASSRVRSEGLVDASFEGGRIRSSTSRLLIGCDGEASSVRSSTGLGHSVVAGERRFVTANVRVAELTSFRFEPFPDGAVVSTGRIDADTHRLMMHIPETTPPLNSEKDVKRAWSDITGLALEGEILSWGVQSDRSMVASSFHDSGVVLAGDAAHSQLAVGGCSLNYGIEDAFNLAWRVGHSLANNSAHLLNDYAIERKFAALRMQRFVGNQINELYARRSDAGAVGSVDASAVPEDEAAFLSGIDVDYRHCDTGAAQLLSAGEEWLRPAQSLALKQSQRSFQYSRIRISDGDHSASPKLSALGVLSGSDGHLKAEEPFVLIRPDGYLVTDASRHIRDREENG